MLTTAAPPHGWTLLDGEDRRVLAAARAAMAPWLALPPGAASYILANTFVPDVCLGPPLEEANGGGASAAPPRLQRLASAAGDPDRLVHVDLTITGGLITAIAFVSILVLFIGVSPWGGVTELLHRELLTDLPYGWIGVIAAFQFGIWYYLGIEGTCQAAEEVRSEREAMARSMASMAAQQADLSERLLEAERRGEQATSKGCWRKHCSRFGKTRKRARGRLCRKGASHVQHHHAFGTRDALRQEACAQWLRVRFGRGAGHGVAGPERQRQPGPTYRPSRGTILPAAPREPSQKNRSITI